MIDQFLPRLSVTTESEWKESETCCNWNSSESAWANGRRVGRGAGPVFGSGWRRGARASSDCSRRLEATPIHCRSDPILAVRSPRLQFKSFINCFVRLVIWRYICFFSFNDYVAIELWIQIRLLGVPNNSDWIWIGPRLDINWIRLGLVLFFFSYWVQIEFRLDWFGIGFELHLDSDWISSRIELNIPFFFF